MSRHSEYPPHTGAGIGGGGIGGGGIGGGGWEDITPLERQKSQELSSLVFKEALVHRVQRIFLWPLDKVRKVLVEYVRFLLLKDELADFYATILLVPPVIARVWESHIVDTADYRACLDKVSRIAWFHVCVRCWFRWLLRLLALCESSHGCCFRVSLVLHPNPHTPTRTHHKKEK